MTPTMNTITHQPFGYTPAGESVERILLDNGILSCSIITYGAILQSLSVPDRNGKATDIVLGFDTLEEYLADTEYTGAIVGRFGKEYHLSINDGVHQLHGGTIGFSHRLWTVADLSPTHVTLSRFSPDGEEGFPGNLNVRVTYRLEDTALVIHYQAETDADTPCNLTNHSYFNLDGHDAGSIANQQVALFASRYMPVDDHCLVVGTVEPVDGTPMDLQTPTTIGANVNGDFLQLRRAGGYDHNYIIDDSNGSLRKAAQVFSLNSGIAVTVETTQPAIQFYTANPYPVCRGKNHAEYRPQGSFCLETQGFPDAPNHPDFPSAILQPGEQYSHITRFVFTRSQ